MMMMKNYCEEKQTVCGSIWRSCNATRPTASGGTTLTHDNRGSQQTSSPSCAPNLYPVPSSCACTTILPEFSRNVAWSYKYNPCNVVWTPAWCNFNRIQRPKRWCGILSLRVGSSTVTVKCIPGFSRFHNIAILICGCWATEVAVTGAQGITRYPFLGRDIACWITLCDGCYLHKQHFMYSKAPKDRGDILCSISHETNLNTRSGARVGSRPPPISDFLGNLYSDGITGQGQKELKLAVMKGPTITRIFNSLALLSIQISSPMPRMYYCYT